MAERPQPIGYWLKHLDALIEASFDQVLADDGLTRLHWQVLNTLGTSAATEVTPSSGVPTRQTRQTLAAALSPFLDTEEDGGELEAVLTDLTARGWLVDRSDDGLSCTAEGLDARAAVGRSIGGIRELMTRGLCEREYAETVRVLAHMADNLSSPQTAGQSS